MTIPLKGKLVDVGIYAVLETLASQSGLAYLRLNGSPIDIRIIHVGRGQCFVNDYTRKVRDRVGERLVRWGFLERSILVEQLKRQEDDGQRLDFSDHVPNANLEYVVMNQTLDSLDRLSLFPMLDYEIAPQTTVYRGAKINIAAIRKRFEWMEQHRECFLLWRQRIEGGRLFMPPAARGASLDNAKVDKALTSGSDWSSLQAVLHEPLSNIALRLDTLTAEGHLQYIEAETQATTKVERARWRFLGLVLSLMVVFGGVYKMPPDLDRIGRSLTQIFSHVTQLSNGSHTQMIVGAEVEHFRERHQRHPSRLELKEALLSVVNDVSETGTLSPYQYIGMPDDFVVLTHLSNGDGEPE